MNLGKIDDSRWETIAFGATLRKDELQRRDRGYVFFLQGTHSIPGGVKRRNLPHELDAVRCNSTVSVEEAIVQNEKPSPLGLAVHPNPSSGEVVVSWGKGARGQEDKETRRQGDKKTRRQEDKETRRQGDKKIIRITDILGQEVLSAEIPLDYGRFIWDASDLPNGIYYGVLTTDEVTETRHIRIQR